MSLGSPDYTVDLPAGGRLHLQTADEVDLWNTSMKRYREDYIFAKLNDLVNLGTLLQNQVNLYRAQTAINGMAPETDKNGRHTGRWVRKALEPADLAAAQRTLNDARKEMTALEKTLGIDKAKRESGGSHTVDGYITLLKQAAHARGVHITKRTLAYEAFVNDLRWRIRMLYTADPEDRAYHGITPKTVLNFVKDELEKLEHVDKEFAKEFGALYAGKL